VLKRSESFVPSLCVSFITGQLMNNAIRIDIASRISQLSHATADRQARFLADLIRIRSYTGQEKPAVERTLAELRAIGRDEVWQDSAGNALGRIGHGPRVILYNAHLDTNEVADESEWPHPPLEPVVEGGVVFGPGACDTGSDQPD
jgi:acetylornithine deacetylase/succinyl-diaminopimelate desuccinylase-like protein